MQDLDSDDLSIKSVANAMRPDLSLTGVYTAQGLANLFQRTNVFTDIGSDPRNAVLPALRRFPQSTVRFRFTRLGIRIATPPRCLSRTAGGGGHADLLSISAATHAGRGTEQQVRSMCSLRQPV